jgi:hypothetical protein
VAGAIILKITYGYTIEPQQQDPLVELVDSALEQFAAATVPGAWLVDMIPARKSVQYLFASLREGVSDSSQFDTFLSGCPAPDLRKLRESGGQR